MADADSESGAGSAWACDELWDAEYDTIEAIPSSHRLAPSHALSTLERFAPIRRSRRVLDAGSGGGRHALHFARLGAAVQAVDLSSAACALLGERCAVEHMSDAVTIDNVALGLDDVPGDGYDLIIDSYVSCHILDADERDQYLDSLMANLRPGGHLFTSAMGAGDAYYREFARGPHATDPLNGITKRLRCANRFEKELARVGRVVATTQEMFTDVVDRRHVRREVVAGLLTRD